MPRPTSSAAYLVGDIGGTNARFALVQDSPGRPRLIEPLGLRCADFPTAEAAIDHYLQAVGQPTPRGTVLAIAGPVENGAVISTNGSWTLSQERLVGHGFARAELINDFVALAYGLTLLAPEDCTWVGPPLAGDPGASLAVVGAGTGFGVGAVCRGLGREAIIATEGGHMSFAPVDAVDIDILRLLAERFGRVSVERILSGSGLVDLRQALARIADRPADPLAPEEIVRRALAGDDALCVQTLDRFCAIYGSVAGDIALTFGARGGVFLGGGIAPCIAAVLQTGAFRARFEAKGRFAAYMAAIPTRIILHPFPALLGAAAIAARGAKA